MNRFRQAFQESENAFREAWANPNQYPPLHAAQTGHFEVQMHNGVWDFDNADLGLVETKRTGRKLILIEGKDEYVDMVLGDDFQDRLKRAAEESQK